MSGWCQLNACLVLIWLVSHEHVPGVDKHVPSVDECLASVSEHVAYVNEYITNKDKM